MPVAPAEQHSSSARSILVAFKEAFGAALLAFGLSVPILALRTEQDISNQLVLQPRWGYVAVAVLAAFFGRLLYLAVAAVKARRAPREKAAAWIPPAGLARFVSMAGLILLLLYPPIALA